MQDVIKKSIEQLNEVLTKDKKLVIKNSTPLIDQKSKLESIDIDTRNDLDIVQFLLKKNNDE